MQRRQLGRSDLTITPLVLGCWAISGGLDWGDQNTQDAIDAIHACLDHGIDTFDTAEVYGNGSSEELLGKALEGKRDQAIVMTKILPSNTGSADEIEAHCDASLKRLGTDFIDLYQIHWPVRDTPLDDVLRTLERIRDKGKVRVLGVSNYGLGDMTDLLDIGRIEANQMVYSLLVRAIEYDVLPQCLEHEIGVLCYSPLAQGLLTGKFRSVDDVPVGRRRTRHFSGEQEHATHGGPGCEKATFDAIAAVRDICDELGQPMSAVSLAWAMAQDGVAGVIAGARSREQVAENVKAASLSLDADTIDRLNTATLPVKELLGSNPDVWAASPRIR